VGTCVYRSANIFFATLDLLARASEQGLQTEAMAGQYLIGVDLGTSVVKAGLYDAEGGLVA